MGSRMCRRVWRLRHAISQTRDDSKRSLPKEVSAHVHVSCSWEKEFWQRHTRGESLCQSHKQPLEIRPPACRLEQA